MTEESRAQKRKYAAESLEWWNGALTVRILLDDGVTKKQAAELLRQVAATLSIEDDVRSEGAIERDGKLLGRWKYKLTKQQQADAQRAG